jgi:Protein of unknown function (DUF3179)
MKFRVRAASSAALGLMTVAVIATAGPRLRLGAQSAPPWLPLDVFALAAAAKEAEAKPVLDRLAKQWRIGYASMLLELAEFSRAPRVAAPLPGGDASQLSQPSVGDAEELARGGPTTEASPAPRPVSPVRARLFRFLERSTRQRFGHDFVRWHQWIWAQPYDPHPDLADFKGRLYASIDPRMADFFRPGARASIRLDEIEWGGVVVNGIPPLVYPKTVPAAQAQYLRDNHVIFGIAVNGRARAYPKRILAWHELARDRVGGVELTVVYCTLCGTVIPYDSVAAGRLRVLGTSGLLYRSNKLMFDEETRSLWSTLDGRPVVGPLVGSDAVLTPRAAVTTTWGEWRRRHPQTDVLSLETGHQRDYSEGAAYRDYFATDRLMFSVPSTDTRLSNKAEVLVMRLPLGGGRSQPVAIDAEFLARRPVYQTRLAEHDVVIVTSRGGANRAYDASGRRFVRLLPDDRLLDDQNVSWQVTEDALVGAEGIPPRRRLAAQRAFWFGWHAQFPDTILIK